MQASMDWGGERYIMEIVGWFSDVRLKLLEDFGGRVVKGTGGIGGTKLAELVVK